MDHCYFYGLLCDIFFWKPVARMVRAFNKISTDTKQLQNASHNILSRTFTHALNVIKKKIDFG